LESSGGLDPETIRQSIKKKKRYGVVADYYASYKEAFWHNLIIRSPGTPYSSLQTVIFIVGFSTLAHKASGSIFYVFMDFFEIVILYALTCAVVSSLNKRKFWTQNKISNVCMVLLALIVFIVLANPPFFLLGKS